jgi:lipopolysaccharide export LptBFGC system permease protein LptF
MNIKSLFVGGLVILLAVALASPMLAQEEKKAEKAEKGEKSEKAKAQKVSGDIGLLDTEKNYMIVVTKDGKLVTLDFNQKTKVTELKESQAKMADIGLGSSAVVEYSVKGDKNVLSKIEFTPAKGE